MTLRTSPRFAIVTQSLRKIWGGWVRNAFLLAGLFAGLSLSLPGCATSQTPPLEGQIGDVGAQVIAAIQAGDDLSKLRIFHQNYEHDPVRVASLENCEYTVLPATRQYVLHLDWTCSQAANSAFTRIYLPEGKLSRLEFQPSIASMAPTHVGSVSPQPLSEERIHEEFRDAVISGSDPTLGGLLPISAKQREQLAGMKDWLVFRVDASGDYGAETVWLDKERSSGADTTIHFDDAGRPIGFWLRIAPIRTVVTTTTAR